LSPTSPRAKDDTNPNKSSLNKELDKLTPLKKHSHPHVVNVHDFETLYNLPKTGKISHKLKIPLDLVETNLIDIFGLAKGRKKRVEYTYS